MPVYYGLRNVHTEEIVIAGECLSRYVAESMLADFIFTCVPPHVHALLKRTERGFDIYHAVKQGMGKKRKWYFIKIYEAYIDTSPIEEDWENKLEWGGTPPPWV